MIYTIRPISDRTAFLGKHKSNPFRSTWAQTLKLLGSELAHLKARDVVIECDATEGDIRIDGMLRANAKVSSPSVRLAFESMHGPLTYATDRYHGAYYNDPPDWQINIRAIALGLKALRTVETYGIIRRGEQYAGFKALNAGRSLPASHMTTDEAERVLWDVSQLKRDLPWNTSTLFKKARIRSHPDLHMGDRTQWNLVEEAGGVLGVAR